MKKYCVGVGVFDTDDAEIYELASRTAMRHIVIYGLNDGDTWVMQSRKQNFATLQLSKLSYEETARQFSRYNKDLPDNLVKHLTSS